MIKRSALFLLVALTLVLTAGVLAQDAITVKGVCKDEAGKPDATKPSGDGKSESVRIEPPKESGSDSAPVLRADPVPPVTPAPPASSAPSDSPSVSAAVSSGTPEAGPGPSAAPAQPSASPAVTASAPPPPVAPAGPPAPPISQ